MCLDRQMLVWLNFDVRVPFKRLICHPAKIIAITALDLLDHEVTHLRQGTVDGLSIVVVRSLLLW